MSATGKAIKLGQNLPNYPGRESWEAMLGPLLTPLAKNLAGRSVQRLLGFWVMWHAYGNDFKLMVDQGPLSQRGVYGQRSEFRDVFGVEVGDFLPEIAALIRQAGVRDHVESA